MEKILVSSYETVCCSFVEEDDVSLTVDFAVCDFSINANDKELNRQTANNWIYTLVSSPVVGKIIITDSGEADFSQHNLYKIIRTDENGNPYLDTTFDSSAFGVFTSCEIKELNGKEFIIGRAKIWKRYFNFSNLIKKRAKEGTIYTSWEIGIKKSHTEIRNGKPIEVIDDAVFLGHCLLGKVVPPAYSESKVLQVASSNIGIEDLISAVSLDIKSFNNTNKINKEDIGLATIENKEISAQENITDTSKQDSDSVKENGTTSVDTSSLTEWDLRKELRKAITSKIDGNDWFYILYHFPVERIVWVQTEDMKETEVLVFNYTVENDIVTVSDPTKTELVVSVSEINKTVANFKEELEKKNEVIISANASIKELEKEVSELKGYKEKFEIAEQEKIKEQLEQSKKDLAEYVVKSGVITKKEIEVSEEIKGYIDTLNKKELQAIIVDRLVTEISNKDESANEVHTPNSVETSATFNLNNVETVSYKDIIKDFIKK